MIKVFLSLGSNLGDRELYMKKAIEELQINDCIEITMISSYYETLPENGSKEQPMYINAAVEIMTTLSPHQLLDVTQEIERKLGRKTKNDYSPRTIDIDIIFYGDELIIEEDLTIPHPLMHERKFVLEPLAEIDPDIVHPMMDKTVKELLDELEYSRGLYN